VLLLPTRKRPAVRGFHGVNAPGAFAEYFAVQGNKVYKIENLTDEGATLVEPSEPGGSLGTRARKIAGAEVLLIGCGPTGLMLTQLLKVNGACRIVLAAPGGTKLELAKRFQVADEYIELDRVNA